MLIAAVAFTLGAQPAIETIEGERGHVRRTDPIGAILGSIGNDQQDRQLRNARHEKSEHFVRRGIDPVDIFEHHENRLLPGQAGNLVHQRIQGAFLLLLGRVVQRRITVHGQRQQRRKQRRDGGNFLPLPRQAQQRLDFVESVFGAIFLGEAGGPLEGDPVITNIDVN
jgi:hypothetical protein